MSEALKDVETRPDNGTVEKFTGDEEAKVLEQWKAAKAREEDKRAREMEFAKTIQDAMQKLRCQLVVVPKKAVIGNGVWGDAYDIRPVAGE